LVLQIINLSFRDIFKKYSGIYKIFRETYSSDLLAIEIRDIPPSFAASIQNVILQGMEICYKIKKQNSFNLFIPGQINNFKLLARRVLAAGDEDLGYKLMNLIKNFEEYPVTDYQIAGKKFNFNSAYVMGILNVTPDSFSDGGKYLNIDDAASYANNMIEEGADIIDIGGESTRPGSEPVTADIEISRVLPVIKKILLQNPKAIISVDTTKSAVAEESLKAGALIINDISGSSFDPEMIPVVKKYNAAYVIMHIKGTPKDMQNNPVYEDLISEVYDYLYINVNRASKAGIKNIFIDPGIGFGKRVEDNFEILRRLEDFKSLGFPILTGVSRKSFIGKTVDLKAEDRDSASAVIDAVAIRNGARVIRTHNVKLGSAACKLLNKLH
jgi:dihydropteroate synthase